nr:vacuolar protein sorting-associated protein 26A [Ipomoea trifida]
MLFWTLTRIKEEQFARPNGMDPEKELLNRMSLIRLPLLHNPGGTSPVKKFVETSSHCKGEFLPRSFGKDPFSEFCQSSSTSSFLSSPILLGIGPVSRLHMRFSSCKFFNSAISLGISPENLLSERSKNIRELIFPISGGIFPSNLLRMIVSSDFNSPSSAGIFPVRLFPDSPRNLRLCRFLKEAGIEPSKKLPRKSRSSSPVTLPRSSGNNPTKLLLEAFRYLRPGAFPSPAGNVPTKLLELTSTLLNRVRFASERGNDEDKNRKENLGENQIKRRMVKTLKTFFTIETIALNSLSRLIDPYIRAIQVPLKKENGRTVTVPLFQSQENITGKISIEPISGKKIEHNGIKVELLGQIGTASEQNSFFPLRYLISDFFLVVRELDVPGELYERKTYPFDFSTVEMPYETYNGVNVRLRYVLKVTISRGYAGSIVEFQDFVVRNYSPPPPINNSIKMEVGIEDCLHIEFEYNKSKYNLKDVIIGKIYFLLVRIKIKNMDLEIRRRESTGSGATAHVETETLAKFELMDGAPVRGESIPIRLFLSPYELTPTYRNINNKFSVKYYLNLVLVDEEDRRYFKQQEVTLYRLAETS